ncbi:MAG: non-homologous end-joining DNA ligase [Archaeoglobaceae archaeon]
MSWFDTEIAPMLAIKGEPFDSSDHVFEPKWDGTRCLAFIDIKNQRIKLQNRRFNDITHRYPELELTDFVKENAIIDGEIIVLEDRKPSFKLLQEREQVDNKFKINILSKVYPAIYFVFDVLYTESRGWVTSLPLTERKEILQKITSKTSHIMLSEHIERKGKHFYQVSVDAGLEGIIGKKKSSLYQMGKRSSSWIKMKKRNTADCIIAGWLEGEGGRREYFASFILALLDNKGNYIHIGRVGTGFSNEFLKEFTPRLKEVEVKQPVKPHLKLNVKREIHWVKPHYVCEVEFLEVTPDKKLRAPVFLRIRTDKPVEECTLDQIDQ